MSTLRVSIVEGPTSPTSATFQGEPLFIGRASSCDLVLSDSLVSRRHASIACEDGRFVLTDLKSSNGTFVGDDRAPISRKVLRDGDSIRIGYNVLRVSIVDDEAKTALAPTIDPDATVTLLHPNLLVPPTLVLTVLSGPDRGKVFAPQNSQVQIGRLSTCDVWLSDPGISRVHATIRREAFGFAIYDEDSKNGLRIGDPPQRVFFSRLEDGMVLRLSSTEVQVTITGSACDVFPARVRSHAESPGAPRKEPRSP